MRTQQRDIVLQKQNNTPEKGNNNLKLLSMTILNITLYSKKAKTEMLTFLCMTPLKINAHKIKCSLDVKQATLKNNLL